MSAASASISNHFPEISSFLASSSIISSFTSSTEPQVMVVLSSSLVSSTHEVNSSALLANSSLWASRALWFRRSAWSAAFLDASEDLSLEKSDSRSARRSLPSDMDLGVIPLVYLVTLSRFFCNIPSFSLYFS